MFSPVVSSCACQRHASPCRRATYPNDALRSAVLPLLRLQHPWWHRRRWYVTDSTPTNRMLMLGLNRLGTGAVYSFDPVGSYEREACRAAGAAQSLVQPFLDNQVSWLSVRLRCRPCYVRRHPILTRLTPVCLSYRYTSRISNHRLAQHTQRTCRYRMSFQSSLTPSPAPRSDTSR